MRLLLVPYDSGQRNVRMGAGPLCAAPREAPCRSGTSGRFRVIMKPRGIGGPKSRRLRAMRSVAKHVRAARTAEDFPRPVRELSPRSALSEARLGDRGDLDRCARRLQYSSNDHERFLDGMTLATATGQCWESWHSVEGFEPVPENAVVLLGARDLDPGEVSALARSQIIRLSVEAAKTSLAPVLQSISSTMERFYVHLDLDALDPSVGRANGYAARGGFLSHDLQTLLSTIAEHLPVEALTIASYDPSYDGDGAVCAAAFEASAALLSGVGSTQVR